MSAYPAELHVETSTFLHRPDLYALRLHERAPPPGALALLEDGEQTTLAVYEGSPPAGADAGPVYATSTSGTLAVPTGRVFVRLAAGLAPSALAADFERLGFAIQQTLAYAPGAVWLRPIAGSISSALAGLPELRRLDAVEHLEPQLLLERAWKG